MKEARLVQAIVGLYEHAACDLPPDVCSALERSLRSEKGRLARETLRAILKSAELARRERKPLCQDTGTPIFFVRAEEGGSREQIRQAILKATEIATNEIPLRPNAVDPLSGKNSGNNLGTEYPPIFYEPDALKGVEITLYLKGGGSENVGATYRLPDAALRAERDREGIRRAVIDAVVHAQGFGCPPYLIGVAVAGTKETAALEAKRQLIRKLDDRSPRKELAALEKRLLAEVNRLGIGPGGFGGKSTALSVKIGACHRHPASYFVEVCFACWALRRWKLRYQEGVARYE